MTAREWAEELDRRLDAMGLTIQEDGMAVAEALIQEAIAEERAACAQVPDGYARDYAKSYKAVLLRVAEKIRGRT